MDSGYMWCRVAWAVERPSFWRINLMTVVAPPGCLAQFGQYGPWVSLRKAPACAPGFTNRKTFLSSKVDGIAQKGRGRDPPLPSEGASGAGLWNRISPINESIIGSHHHISLGTMWPAIDIRTQTNKKIHCALPFGNHHF